ncbi:MAG: TIGR02584 family CRISPR-associated protein [Nitrospira sp.]|nr:TIGR02584 family CRISPR-associated protein [Nitrospira sp.]
MIMQPDRPETYPRRVLLSVSGLTPQVITETLYALAMRSPPFVPTEVHVITTELGRQRFVAHINQFRQFFQEYELPVPRCDAGDVHVIAGADGRSTDVRTPRDNEHVANLVMRTVLELTSDPQCAVHASIAGGRKTMGFYLGYLMSMFGRDQDRISHVLMHEDFENLADFFYPPRKPHAFTTPDGRQVTSGPDSVLLSEIPFVRHRGGFRDKDLRREGMSFRQAVELAQRSVQRAELVVDVAARKVLAGGVDVPMQDNPRAFLVWLADCRKQGVEGVHYLDSPQAFLGWYERVLNDEGSVTLEDTKYALRGGFSKEDIRNRTTSVNMAFRQALGSVRAKDYEIVLIKRGTARYSLTLPASAITILGAPRG